MYIIEATEIASFLARINRKYKVYTDTFPRRSIKNIDDIMFAATRLYAYGTPFANQGKSRQLHYLKADIPHLEKILLPFVEKVWNFFNEDSNTANTQANFDQLQEDLCELFLDIFNKDGKYHHTYGNAQKMVNMLFKYLTCFEDYMAFADLFSHCHIPIDGIILGRFARVYHVPGTTGVIDHGEYYGVCWSKMSKSEYTQLLADYRAIFSPIKCDNTWLSLEYPIWVGAPIRYTGVHAAPIEKFYM